eukprot:SAG25_NODE_2975_length_1285_cov_13.217538_1_plen_216_part_00
MDERPAKDDTSKKQATSKLSASSTSSLRPPPPPITAPMDTGGHPRSLQDTNHGLQPDPLPHTAASIVTKANDHNQDTLDDDEPAHAKDLADVQLQPPQHDGCLAWTTGHLCDSVTLVSAPNAAYPLSYARAPHCVAYVNMSIAMLSHLYAHVDMTATRWDPADWPTLPLLSPDTRAAVTHNITMLRFSRLRGHASAIVKGMSVLRSQHRARVIEV